MKVTRSPGRCAIDEEAWEWKVWGHLVNKTIRREITEDLEINVDEA